VSYLLNVSILYSVSRQAESRRQCDLYLNPPLLKIGLLQWNQFDTIVRQGSSTRERCWSRPRRRRLSARAAGLALI